MEVKEQMKHKLKLLAGLRPQSPTDEELELIIDNIIELARTRRPTETDWENAARKYVPNAGKYKNAGKDPSDLNALLVQILKQDDPPRVKR
jgi:hypothetical protein